MTRNPSGGNSECPKCHEHSSYVVDSRPSTMPNVRRRRRYKCPHCNHTWGTHEIDVSDNGDIVSDARRTAILFMDDIERAVRKRFGSEAGHIKIGRK